MTDDLQFAVGQRGWHARPKKKGSVINENNSCGNRICGIELGCAIKPAQ